MARKEMKVVKREDEAIILLADRLMNLVIVDL